jgi:S-(hydroxymethyl)glutathione dehydrogenase/alcohol dehydrogenase
MKAAVMYQAKTPMVIEDVNISKPGPHEVLVRTAAVGLCHSDLHFIDGNFPYPTPTILGHEAAGIVEQVGSEVRSVKPGDHVVTCLSAFCGHCHHCVTGHLNLCVSPETKREENDEPRLLPMKSLSASSSIFLLLLSKCWCMKTPLFQSTAICR